MNTKQAQFLKTYLSKQITQLETKIKVAKSYVTSYYDLCDKGDPENTKFYYQSMNEGKDLVRRYTQERNKPAAIQKIVKQLAK